MEPFIEIGRRRVGSGYPTYIVAEMSANHCQSFDDAVRIVQKTKEVGADAIKLQTYTPDTITLRCEREWFRIQSGTIWDGRTLYNLYQEAYTPWEWQPKLKVIAEKIGLTMFSTAFDGTSVDFLESLDVSVHKVASFELVDIPLIEKMARAGKPMILSTGMATLAEIEDAVHAARNAGATQIALLKCTSAYPAPAEEMNLRTIPHMAEAFDAPIGLSDHTLGIAVPIAAVSLGACIVEKHLTLSRSIRGPDSAFSLEPQEFKEMVDAIRTAEAALGRVYYGPSKEDIKSRVFRRSLFTVQDVKKGDPFTEKNVRSIRPAHGLSPKHQQAVLRHKASRDIQAGEPLRWDLITD